MMTKLCLIAAMALLLSCGGSRTDAPAPKEAPAGAVERKAKEAEPDRESMEAPLKDVLESTPGVFDEDRVASEIPKAAAHNDNEEYPYFLEFLERFQALRSVYHRSFADRHLIKISNGQQPLFNVPFRIVKNDSVLWQAVTYANGENVVFPHLMFAGAAADKLQIEIDDNGQTFRRPLNHQHQRITEIELANAGSQAQQALEILFILDTTGSMGDEIQKLQDTIFSIHTRIKNAFNSLPIRFGLILEQVFREKGLTLAGFVQNQNYGEVSAALGSDLILFGDISYAGVDHVVFMRAVRTDNGQIVAAARVRL